MNNKMVANMKDNKCRLNESKTPTLMPQDQHRRFCWGAKMHDDSVAKELDNLKHTIESTGTKG